MGLPRRSFLGLGAAAVLSGCADAYRAIEAVETVASMPERALDYQRAIYERDRDGSQRYRRAIIEGERGIRVRNVFINRSGYHGVWLLEKNRRGRAEYLFVRPDKVQEVLSENKLRRPLTQAEFNQNLNYQQQAFYAGSSRRGGYQVPGFR